MNKKEWIKTSEKVPEISQDLPHMEKNHDYLCVYELSGTLYYAIGYYYDYGDHRKGWDCGDWHFENKTPVYWMELPDMPEKEVVLADAPWIEKDFL